MAAAHVNSGRLQISCPFRRQYRTVALPSELNREWQAQSHFLIEVHYEHLVVRVAGSHEGPGRRDHIRKLAEYASAVVDDQ